jgi:cation diffusion facilitator family transporter
MAGRISAERVVLTSFLVDLSDILLNVVVAVLSGSVVMLSQTLQGTADLLTSGLLVVGIRQASRRATSDYRFGYGRELFFWTLVAGVSMFAVTGMLSVVFGIQRLITPQPIDHVGLSQLILTVGVATNGYALALSYRRLTEPGAAPGRFWRRWYRSTLLETKTTLSLDLMGTVASLLGLVALGLYQLTGSLAFDGIGSIIIGLTTMAFSLGLIANAKALLVGRSASAELVAQIRQALADVPNVRAVRSVHTLHIGTEQLLANVDVHAAPNLTTPELERLVEQLKHQVKNQVPTVRHLQVELSR